MFLLNIVLEKQSKTIAFQFKGFFAGASSKLLAGSGSHGSKEISNPIFRKTPITAYSNNTIQQCICAYALMV